MGKKGGGKKGGEKEGEDSWKLVQWYKVIEFWRYYFGVNSGAPLHWGDPTASRAFVIYWSYVGAYRDI